MLKLKGFLQTSILEIGFKSEKMESIHLFKRYLLSTDHVPHQGESERFDDEQSQHGPCPQKQIYSLVRTIDTKQLNK